MESMTDKCPICKGTGFSNGKICSCITKDKREQDNAAFDAFRDIFGDDLFEMTRGVRK